MEPRISYSLNTSLSLRLEFGLECSVCKREMRSGGNRLKILQQLYARNPDNRPQVCCCCLQRTPQDIRHDSDYLARWHTWFRNERCSVCDEVFGPITRREHEQREKRTAKRSGPERFFICCGCWQLVDTHLHTNRDYCIRWNQHRGC